MRLGSKRTFAGSGEGWQEAGCHHPLACLPGHQELLTEELSTVKLLTLSTHPWTAAGPCWVSLAPRKAVRKERGLFSWKGVNLPSQLSADVIMTFHS